MWFRARTAAALGDSLAKCRNERAMTQAALAERLKISRPTLITLEAGRNRAVQRLVEAYAFFGYDIVIVPRSADIHVSESSAAPIRP